MGELRNLFEDGMGGFRPSTDEALERTRRRAERRARNRRLLAASVALALAATTLSGLWGAFRLGGESRPAAPVIPEPRIATEIQLQGPPGPTVVAFGHLWVAIPRTGQTPGAVVAIDPATNEIVRTVTDVRSPVDVAAGPDALFVFDADTQTVIRVDPASGIPEATFDIPINLTRAKGFAPVALAATEDSVLAVVEPAIVVEMDAHDGRVISEEGFSGQGRLLDVEVVPGGRWLIFSGSIRFESATTGSTQDNNVSLMAAAVRGDQAWVAWEGLGVQHLSPATGVVRSYPMDGADAARVHGMAVEHGWVWLVADGTLPFRYELVGIDDRTETPAVRLSLGVKEGPAFSHLMQGDITAAYGSVWVGDRDERTLLRIDLSGESAPAPSPLPSVVGDDGDCPPPELEASYLPPGVEPGDPQPGMGGGADPDGQFTNAVHFGDSPGPDGRPAPFIEIFRTGPNGGPLLPEDHARRFGESIEVLGGEGYLVSIEDGWGVWFEHGDDPCNGYELHAYGPTKAETRRFAERLAPVVRGKLKTRGCPAPELRATDLPADFSDRAWRGAGDWAATEVPTPSLGDAGAIHYRSADPSRFIEIRRRSAEEISLVHYPEGRLEEVLGQPAISGPSLSSLSAYAVEFSLGAGRCPVHVVLGAGVNPDEVERFAEGLYAP